MIRPQRWGVKWWTKHTGSQFLWLKGAAEELQWILLSKAELSCYIWFSKKSWKSLCLCEISMAETIDAHPKSVNSPIISSLCCSPVEAIWAVLSNGLWITGIFMGLSLSLSLSPICPYLKEDDLLVFQIPIILDQFPPGRPRCLYFKGITLFFPAEI